MPKLPTVETLGPRPSSRSPRSVVSFQADQVAAASAKGSRALSKAVATGLGAVADTVGDISADIAAADERINRRRDSLERMRSGRELNDFGSGLFTDFESSRDFSKQEDFEAFASAINAKAEEILKAHRGSVESKLRLEERLEPIRKAWADKASVASVTAQEALIDREFSEITNGLAARVRFGEDPRVLIAEGMAQLEAEEDALRPSQEIAFVRVLNSRIWGAKIDDFMAKGAFDEAENMLGMPEVQSAIGEKGQRRAFDRIADVRRELAKIRTEPVKGIPRDVFNRLTPEQQAEVLGATPDETTIKGIPDSVFNELSDDEQKQVLGIISPEEEGRREAQSKTAEVEGILGRPATDEERRRAAGVADRAPVISITQQGESAMAKELGKRDAERVSNLEDDAQNAFRTLAEVARMEAAIKSGRFTTGVFSDFRVFLARFADFVGASEETRELLGDAATSDTLDAAANRLGVEAAQKLGRITNMSLQFVRDSLPSLARTPEGNRILMEVMRRTAEREIQLASLAEDFIQRFSTLRPQDNKTYFQAVRDLETEDPVITEELRQRIIEGSKKPAKSFKELFGDKIADVPTISTQEEVDALESETEFIWKPTGQKMRKD